MARSRSLELLERLLAGDLLNADHLDDLIAKRVVEDLYLDYKHGDLLKDENKSQKTIREYVSAFANSAGGILIIGVRESEGIPQEITGCQNHKGNLSEWASRCLTPIANYLVPTPRFHVVDHPNGQILVCAVQRSLSLVPIGSSEKIIYYFRLHDQTLQAPDYLMADILLGRRQHPNFEIKEALLTNFHIESNSNYPSRDLKIETMFRVENTGIVWADDSQWGVIYLAYQNEQRNEKPSQHLLSYLDYQDKTPLPTMPTKLVHHHNSLSISKPFDTNDRHLTFTFPLKNDNRWMYYTWKAALYFLARNSLPIWYQIEFDVDDDIHLLLIKEWQHPSLPHNKFRITRLTAERPIVAWEENSSVEEK